MAVENPIPATKYNDFTPKAILVSNNLSAPTGAEMAPALGYSTSANWLTGPEDVLTRFHQL
jgi:hypothetical protein